MRQPTTDVAAIAADNLRFLDSLARGGHPRRCQLKPGTVLVRDYQGQRHTVTVGREGFEWQGTTYASLSAIARAITGTSWSGPRFFALKGPRDRATKPKRKSAVEVAQEQRRSPAATGNGSRPATSVNNAPPL